MNDPLMQHEYLCLPGTTMNDPLMQHEYLCLPGTTMNQHEWSFDAA